MNQLSPVLVILVFGFGFGSFARVNGDENRTVSKNKVPDVPPVQATLLVNLENEVLGKKDTKLDEKIRVKCQHTDYRSYIKCLLEESKRTKRQGFNQHCSGNSCNVPVIQPQQCVGQSCVQTYQAAPCSGSSCAYVGYNCGGVGCTQVGQNCYGNGCVPAAPCNGSPSCSSPPGPPSQLKDDGEIRREIAEIKRQLEYMRDQNKRLLIFTEKATSDILHLIQRSEPKIIREPVLVGQNTTTNIDINNYLNNTNVINVPHQKNEIINTTKTHCCTVVQPKTCRRTLRHPYVSCGHKTHRTCGSSCLGQRVVHSRVRTGCNEHGDENCVSYHPTPYNPNYAAGYPISGYYPPTPMFYPIYVPAPYPQHFAPTVVEEEEDCEGCDTEVVAEDCGDDTAECDNGPKRGDRATGSRLSRGIPPSEIFQVKKEAQAIKQSEYQLTASLDMLEEALELKKLKKESEEDEKSITKSKTIGESTESSAYPVTTE